MFTFCLRNFGEGIIPYCTECGKEGEEEATYCPECGSEISKGKPTKGRHVPKKKLIAAVLVITVIFATWYFLFGSGARSDLRVTITPREFKVGDAYSAKMIVTNSKSDTMIIQGGIAKEYANNILQRKENFSKYDLEDRFSTTTIPPGETKTVLSVTSAWRDIAGSWRIEVSLSTNYGKLKDSTIFTVLE